MRARLIGCILGIFLTPGMMVQGGEPTSQAGAERFEKKVRPLLAARCWGCHGAEKNKGGLRLHSAEAVAKGGDSGAVLIGGKPDDSSLIEVIRYVSDLKMPPKGKLSDAEILELTEWVRSGAIWPPSDAPKPVAADTAASSMERPELFWAFQPVKDPIPPTVEALGWPTSGLDPFILNALEAKQLSPSPPANKRSLIRRATFDLIGLPPTVEEIDSFLADDTSHAFAKVIDRLLASPRYGERWGRHWLDLARYADSNGMDENVGYANAYRYRDYVVAAFNKDTPYNQFVKEQIAGDLLTPSREPATNFARTTATGFLVLGPKMLAEDDPAKMEMDIIDEQVDTVGRVFMGLTIGCARCHDHKFDPIPTADYYSLAGIFKSTKSMANHKVVAMWNERALASQAESEASAVYKTELARREKELKGQVDEARKSLRQETRSKVGQYLVAGWQWDQSRQLRKSVMATAMGEPRAGMVIREAESFNRGNVLIDTTHYGPGIGVILNKGELPNFVEYDVDRLS